MKSRFIYIIFAIMLVLTVHPFLRPLGLFGHLFSTLIIAMVPLSSAFALAENRKKTTIILLITVPFVMLDGVNYFFKIHSLMIVAFSFGTALYFYISYSLVKNILSIKLVTADLIYCAISTYFLIGMGWTGIYIIVEGISPGSFSGKSEPVDLLYFSFVSLTTVGYGDVVPLSVLGQRLAVLEAAMGSIYMAVIVAMIVGRYMLMHLERESESDTSLKK